MKKQVSLIALLAFLLMSFKVTDDVQDKEQNVIWFGIDFSNARLIGSYGFSDPEKIRDTYFPAINNLVLSEPKKYNLEKYYKLPKVRHDLSVVKERNKSINMDESIIDDFFTFEEGQLEKVVREYVSEQHTTGTGILYVVEALNKTQATGHIHVVFFDIASKEILWTKKYEQLVTGFGFRNYWASSVYRAMKASGKDYRKFQRKQRKK
ncbi:hypothetical protein RCC89_04290 [Cytophagaceae bacterium ABcell3]|nr:hypothetical protein RCC89_04290 [Cytophagaceae bacterium ABcell3]